MLSGFPLFYYLFVTSLLCSRLELFPLLFITSQCYLFRVSIVLSSVCYVIVLFSTSIVSSYVCYVSILSLQGFHCFTTCSLRHCSRLRLFHFLFVGGRPTIAQFGMRYVRKM